ncbi:Uu.00g115830.m01.CDS01 [Anthostomella pinea]|uniref:Uu.00g115830.m01.CDS01 n=1 Tax=Anthostomella pinea TaxID=933095 RepID=A0AAI8VFW2_9PEZI|nr:Uu.00g115830.m01.CDS01 [Anthostomella pinea]
MPPSVPRDQGDLDLLESGFFSDVVVKCKDREWKLHKIILYRRSEYFKKALTGGYSEARTGIIEIKEQEPEDVDQIIRYLYTGRRTIEPSDEAGLFMKLKGLYMSAEFFMLQEVHIEDRYRQATKGLYDEDNFMDDAKADDFFDAVQKAQALPNNDQLWRMYVQLVVDAQWIVQDISFAAHATRIAKFAVEVLKSIAVPELPIACSGCGLMVQNCVGLSQCDNGAGSRTIITVDSSDSDSDSDSDTKTEV